MANRRTLLKAIETVRAGGRPPMALDRRRRRRADRARTRSTASRRPTRWEAHWTRARRAPSAPARRWLAATPASRCRRAGCAEAARRAADACARRRRGARAGLRGVARRIEAEGDRARARRLVRPARRAARQDADRRRRCRARFASGVGMVSTILLKDTSDRTAYRVFEPGAAAALPGFGFANNLVLLPDPASFRVLPWAPATGWMRARGLVRRRHAGADRHAPRAAGARWRASRAAGFGLRCGLEVEFHIYRLADRDGDRVARSGSAPPGRASRRAVTMIHPGYNLLAEGWADMADEPLRDRPAHRAGPRPAAALARDRARPEPGRGGVRRRPTRSPPPTRWSLFRNGVRQALRRAGYHASFVCRPPFPNVMASGWHLHQSLRRSRRAARNAFVRDAPARGQRRGRRAHTLSDVGAHWLAGLLAHGRGDGACSARRRSTPTRASGRTRWRRSRCSGAATTAARCCACSAAAATRRRGSRTASASRRPTRTSTSRRRSTPASTASSARLAAPPATGAPYGGSGDEPLPTSLGEALDALAADERAGRARFGAAGRRLVHAAQALRARAPRPAPTTRDAWQAREYFSRF